MALRGIPEAFQSRHAIRRLNIGAVGLALGCITGIVLGEVVGRRSDYSEVALAIAFSTFCVGAFWAAFFRPKGVAGHRGFRIGWGISAVLAMLNAQLACLLVAGVHDGYVGLEEVVQMLVAAPTLGIVLWLPALLFTFVCFGAPIVRAQVLAEKGLAGAERGELLVGTACVAIAGLGLLLSLAMPSAQWLDAFSPIRVVGYLGMLAGGMAAYAASIREGRRRAFVREVEAGNVAGFRVDPSPEGKVLVRVTSHGEGYRVSDFREELVELDASGEAKRARYCELP
ncbi:hypothetical protein LVJ94_00605 [Pendulispora rubella]|uniref:Uncharacterized protein n=1 Tax=Pendulispora rubella TaxID=2741070 RepID=A0ABZ2L4H3_9BACT